MHAYIGRQRMLPFAQADHLDMLEMRRELRYPAVKKSKKRIRAIDNLRKDQKLHIDIIQGTDIMPLSPTEKITLQGSVLVGPFLCISKSILQIVHKPKIWATYLES